MKGVRKMTKVYYDEDADIKYLEKDNVLVIGYGSQGRAQALNLRDSNLGVVVANKKDSYHDLATKDGFDVKPIAEAVKDASIIFVLIPDQAHKDIFNEFIKPNIKEGAMLVFAHGYSLRFKQIEVSDKNDIILLAPRMPGFPIRNYYLDGGGAPAFFSVYQDATGMAEKKGLALCKALGFTKSGVMHISMDQEAELDLFIEQFLLPVFFKTIQTSFDVLVERGFDPIPVLMELYASGEIGELFLKATEQGIYQTFQKNASPTCQFGISESFGRLLPENIPQIANEVLDNIQNGDFAERLEKEAGAGYPKLNAFNDKNNSSLLTETQEKITKFLKYKPLKK